LEAASQVCARERKARQEPEALLTFKPAELSKKRVRPCARTDQPENLGVAKAI
ncbi:hypothetical protein chiPu_0027880, partial [Chiloscyllium punctatum]|nr:hypothetical protein [Chiloscyllium punctatum]